VDIRLVSRMRRSAPGDFRLLVKPVTGWDDQKVVNFAQIPFANELMLDAMVAPAQSGRAFKKLRRQDMTARSSKIRELGDALIAEGYLTLDEQAKALGLGRGTTWTILKGNHKTSGLSADVINRMLAAPQLPALVQAKILEYIDEKIASFYGHSNTQLRRFTARLSIKPANRTRRSGTKADKGDRELEKQFNRDPSQLFAFADEAA
jgi:hypothetical protein